VVHVHLGDGVEVYAAFRLPLQTKGYLKWSVRAQKCSPKYI
jgi:hypothetical protein